ncbi:MAG: energy-coupling factor transporter transmembrane protein EcfT [Ruminococcus sp.]|nr:energy-coupling factor transporter transmembrane protein EcfT [Ruminococcus sp.]
MKTLESSNPIVLFFFFLYVTALSMFISFPFLIIISLFGAMAYYYSSPAPKKGSFTVFVWVLFLVLSAANPLISHKGETILLFINNRPITLESFYFGLNSSAMIVSALYWFRTLTVVLTSDKLIYLTSFLSKNLSLIISMSVRFVPMFGRQRKKIKETQLAMGLYNDDSIVDDIRSNIRVFSILITWALENGITAADSMEARGFSLGKRSCMRQKRIDIFDIMLIILMSALFGITLAGRLFGGMSHSFYPRLSISFNGIKDTAALLSFALLAFLPVILKAEVSLRWHLLKQRV